jgi:MYXO-CTERM domain-containing protein
LLQQVCDSGAARQSVIFAVTNGGVDPEMLARCYEFGVFYPVRPGEIRANLDRSLPAAERRAQQRAMVVVEAPVIESEDEDVKAAMPEVVEEVIHTSKTFAWLLAAGATSIVCMRHSLGIVAQEWAASLLSAVASMWFVQEVTADFRGLLNVGPPSAGPSYLLALSLLLWLCAKRRRASNKEAAAIVHGD